MNDETLRERLRARLHAPSDPPIEATRKFLQSYCSDAGTLEEVRRSVADMLAINTRTVEEGLAGIEALLADPPAEAGTLLSLVAYDANWRLEDHTDEGAKRWLEEMARLLREELEKKKSLS